MTEPGTQLYLISPLDVSGDFPARLERALDAGKGVVTAFQFRVKDLDQHDAARLAEPLQAICAERDVAFIVNDSVALAKRLKADGVHLGQDDGDPRDAREELGREAQIGITCHASRHMAMDAGEAGADYVAFGAFFESLGRRSGRDDTHFSQSVFGGSHNLPHSMFVHLSDAADPKTFNHSQFARIDDKTFLFHQVVEPAEFELGVSGAEKCDDDWG